MIRLLLRFLSLCLLAIAFIALVVDATRSFAAGKLSFTPIGETLSTLAPETWAYGQSFIERHAHPFLWNSILSELGYLPVWFGFGVAGIFFAWLAKKPAQKFGFSSR